MVIPKRKIQEESSWQHLSMFLIYPSSTPMKRRIILSLLLFGGIIVPTAAQNATSPDGRLTAVVEGNSLQVSYKGQQVLRMNLSTEGHLQYSRKVTADYQMLTGKRLHCQNEANEYEIGKVVLRMYNDGIALRNTDVAYHIPEGTRRWMQQWCDSYEGFFPLDTTYKVIPVPSYSGISKSTEGWNNRWGYPALLEVRGQRSENKEPVYALITEANIERGQSASYLINDGEWFRVTPAEMQTVMTQTPWRVVIIGSLKDVVQSTLVTDVSDPCQLTDTSWIHPGVVSWIYWAYNHGSNDYDIIREYVDMAATLHLPYVLIDAEWDEMKNGKTIEDAINYAKSKGVKPLIWYNSSIGWVDGAPGPKFRLNKPEDREREFSWCEQIGVAGVKIDFFSGDNQKNMDYCIDLLESAARHHLLVNFHGATIPRGWQRTWPNLMTTEGVYGAEWYNNVPTFTDKAACHNATLPFTRNVIGPMDYTPCTFSDSQHPHITTNAHELALTVLFESGLQHLADKPESYLSQPDQVQQFLSALPSVWDETRLIDGYPGRFVILARRSGRRWYVAGINGQDIPQNFRVPLDFLKNKIKVTVFADNDTKDVPWDIRTTERVPQEVSLQPRGGFVWMIE